MPKTERITNYIVYAFTQHFNDKRKHPQTGFSSLTALFLGQVFHLTNALIK